MVVITLIVAAEGRVFAVGVLGHLFYNVPQGTEIFVGIQRCYDPPPNPPNNPSWHEVPLYFTYVGNNRYDLYGQDLSDQSWDYIGYFRFYPTTPPACCLLLDGPCVNLCEQPFNPPDINIYRIPNEEICNEPGEDPAGVFRGLYWELREGEELTLTPCQDPMTGNVKFKYATNQTSQIDLPYNLELCPDRIAHFNLTRIDNLQEFRDVYIDNLSTTDPNESCQLRQWLIRHQGIDANGNQTGYEILYQNGIWLTASTLAHEEQHRQDYEFELNEARDIFDEFYNSYSIPCSTYKADPTNVELVAINNYKAKLYQFSDHAQSEYDRKLNEIELNGRDEVLNSINSYLVLLDEFIIDTFGRSGYEEILKICK